MATIVPTKNIKIKPQTIDIFVSKTFSIKDISEQLKILSENKEYFIRINLFSALNKT